MQIAHTLRRAKLLWGNDTAVLDGDLTLTYGQMAERVQRLAGALRELGVGDDDKVAVLMLNGYRYLELFYAVSWAGGVVVPLNIRLAPREIVHQVNEAECKVLVVDAQFAKMVPPHASQFETISHVVFADAGPPPDGMLSYDDLLTTADAIADAGRGGDDVFGIFYTGGTTGRAKGVMLTHANIVANAQNSLLSNDTQQHDVYLHSAPMFHLADCSSTFGLTWIGGKHAFIPFFEPKSMLDAIQRFRVTRAAMVPAMLNMVINHPQFSDFDVSSLTSVGYGASPIPMSLLKQGMSAFGCKFIQGYGMTELSPLVTVLPAEDHVADGSDEEFQKLKSAGIPVHTAEVKVLDENDEELPRGEIGQICARGPMVMKGYWKQPEATAEALRNGWMHTGDAGYMDEDGYIFLVDRVKDMIVTGGENVYSVEVENALYAHPAVLEAAAIGVPSTEWGEAVHAVIVLKPDQEATEQELIGHCREHIAGYKCPKSISFSAEELPKSGAGKILKRDLRQPFWGDQERQIN